MLDALAEWMMYPMYRYAYGKSGTPRSPTSHPLLAPYGAHRTKDGQVIFGLQNEREWATFCAKVLDRPELTLDPRVRDNNARREHRGELTGLIEDSFSEMTSIEVVKNWLAVDMELDWSPNIHKDGTSFVIVQAIDNGQMRDVGPMPIVHVTFTQSVALTLLL